MRSALVRATPYRCVHVISWMPCWTHRAYELEIVGHGWTMAPKKNKVRAWALDWLACNYGEEEWELFIEWM